MNKVKDSQRVESSFVRAGLSELLSKSPGGLLLTVLAKIDCGCIDSQWVSFKILNHFVRKHPCSHYPQTAPRMEGGSGRAFGVATHTKEAAFKKGTLSLSLGKSLSKEGCPVLNAGLQEV